MGERTPTGQGYFPRTPSESAINKDPSKIKSQEKTWERSQSEINLDNRAFSSEISRSSSLEPESAEAVVSSGKVSEHSKVYWDLSKAAEAELRQQQAAGTAPGPVLEAEESPGFSIGRLKISLQTIHQREELKQDGSGSHVSRECRIYKRSTSETSVSSGGTHVSSKAITHEGYMQGKNFREIVAQSTVEMTQEIKLMTAEDADVQTNAIKQCHRMIVEAWMTPQIGRDYASALCDVLRDEGALDVLLENCWSPNRDIKLESTRLLEQSLTTENRDCVVKTGLENVVKMSCVVKDDTELARCSTGILESLFKHSEHTCSRVIQLGGLESILYSCRSNDKITQRHCANSLANLAIYGGADNQHEMIKAKAPEWLFPLAFSSDDSVRYYACLAIITLSANKEIEVAVVNSGTLGLVQPFILSHQPADFAHSDHSHLHGRSREWLRRLVPVLESKREEAQSLAAFHFNMEAEIKKEQGKLGIFKEIGSIDALKRAASSPNALASKFAAQALSIIGEDVPYKLSQQVPLWSEEDVQHWLRRVGFGEYEDGFKKCRVDGDLLLMMQEEHLKDDVKMSNGLIRKRFLKELKKLKMTSDYKSCDPTRLDTWLIDLGQEFSQYTYQMLASGIDKSLLGYISDENLKNDCGITNGVHRMKIIQAIKREISLVCSKPQITLPRIDIRSQACTPTGGFSDTDGPSLKPIDVFISYRRSNGSQLASLLKVHLQLRGFTVFLDIERLTAGKFDESLLNSVRNAKHFLLVLTPNSLDRCQGDENQKDWVHKEIVTALESACNIVPVMDTKFHWPPADNLPEDMKAVGSFNGIMWIHDYQDACVDKLERFLRGDFRGDFNKCTGTGGRIEPPKSLTSPPTSVSKGDSCPSISTNV
ncbi:NAD(+) hydrolase sarm1-like isoform X3 [Lineus longissimus]|uniref:NAD(+) hydrolase sarm1-like isoform X3 n=1 Tax=Lineus longissimus TaxID=88925 RepID=UPI00315D587B